MSERPDAGSVCSPTDVCITDEGHTDSKVPQDGRDIGSQLPVSDYEGASIAPFREISRSSSPAIAADEDDPVQLPNAIPETISSMTECPGAKTDKINLVDVEEIIEPDEIGQDDEITLVTPTITQPELPPAATTSLHSSYHTPEAYVPRTPLQPKSPVPNDKNAEISTPCPAPSSRSSNIVSLIEEPIKPFKQHSPETLSKKGIKGIFRSPHIVPPPSLPARIEKFDGKNEVLERDYLQVAVIDTQTNEIIGGSSTQINRPTHEDDSREIATAVIVHPPTAQSLTPTQVDVLSKPHTQTEPLLSPRKKRRARKSEVDRLLATRPIDVKPLSNPPASSTTKAVTPPNVRMRGKVDIHEQTVAKASTAPKKDPIAKKRTRKASLDAVTLKSPGKKLRRSGRRSGAGVEMK